MRILLLTRYTRLGASSRYRCYHFSRRMRLRVISANQRSTWFSQEAVGSIPAELVCSTYLVLFRSQFQ